MVDAIRHLRKVQGHLSVDPVRHTRPVQGDPKDWTTSGAGERLEGSRANRQGPGNRSRSGCQYGKGVPMVARPAWAVKKRDPTAKIRAP